MKKKKKNSGRKKYASFDERTGYGMAAAATAAKGWREGRANWCGDDSVAMPHLETRPPRHYPPSLFRARRPFTHLLSIPRFLDYRRLGSTVPRSRTSRQLVNYRYHRHHYHYHRHYLLIARLVIADCLFDKADTLRYTQLFEDR